MLRIKFQVLVIGILVFSLTIVALAEEEETEVFQLGEIVVTGTKTERLLKDVPVETAVITEKSIGESNAETLTDLLKYIPGLDVSNHPDRPGLFCTWRATLRGLGFTDGYGLILIDGQRVKGGGMGEAEYGLNQIPLEMIERVEVVKGPSSVLYGSDAMVGVVNIITKSAPEKPIYKFSGGCGSENDWLVSLSHGQGIGKLSYLLNGSMERSNVGKYGGRDDDYIGGSVSGRANYCLSENSKLLLRLQWNKKDWKYTEGEGIRISPGWEVRFEDSKLAVKGYWYRWNFDHHTPGYTRRKGNMEYRQIESQYSFPLSKHYLTAGGEFLEEAIDYNLAKKTVDTYSLFLQDEWQLLDNLSLVPGIRLDLHSEFGGEVSPRLSALYRITEDMRIRGSIGRSFKSPTIRQMYYLEPYKHGTWYIKSNPDLKAEHGLGYSIGIEREFGDFLLGSLSLFRNDVDDMVISCDTGETYLGLPVHSYKNVAEAYTQGIEFGLICRIVERLSVTLSEALIDTEDKETGKELTYCPKNNAGLKLAYNNKKYGISANFGLKYVDSMFKDTANTEKTDPYFVAEAKLIKEIAKYVKISIEGDNLFNSDYGDPSLKGNMDERTIMGKVSISF